jgi:hypothetical protein
MGTSQRFVGRVGNKAGALNREEAPPRRLFRFGLGLAEQNASTHFFVFLFSVPGQTSVMTSQGGVLVHKYLQPLEGVRLAAA